MLPRRLRLTRAALTHQGKEMRAVSPHFSVSVRPKGGTMIVVSKKVEKTAVGRHRLKRRIGTIVRPFCEKASFSLYARKGSNTLSYKELTEELTELLGRLL